MTLRNKTLLVLGVTLLGLLALLYLIAQTILLAGFGRLEAQEMRSNVQRVLDTLAAEVDGLHATAGDYATWDDTYAFAADGNPAYVEANLIDQTYANLRLNLFVIVDQAGQVRYGGSYDTALNQVGPLPAGLDAHLEAGSPLLLTSASGSQRGLLLLPQGPVLVAARPILTSEGAGPLAGTLILGRYLDAAELDRLAGMTHLALTVAPIAQPGTPDMQAALEAGEPIRVQPLDAAEVAGYSLVNDVYGQPQLVLRVTQPRAIYQEGRATVAFFLLALLLAGLVFGTLTWLLLERFVLARLVRLSEGVRQVGDRADASLRVTLGGQDELTAVAGAINSMLEALTRANQALRDSEEKFRKLAETSAAAIFIAQGARMRYANTRAEVLTGYSADDLMALPFDSVVPAEAAPAGPAAPTTALAAGGSLPAQREIQITTPRGRARWLEVTAGPIDYEGQPATIATAYDITERKRAQESLQQANAQLTGLVGQLEQHNRERTLLAQMSDLLQACPTAEESYTVIRQFLQALFVGQTSVLFLYRASRDHLTAVAVSGALASGPPESSFPPEACWSLRLGRVHSLAAPGQGPQCSHVAAVPAGGYLCVPISAQGEALGVLHLRLSAPEPGSQAPDWRRLAEVVGERLALSLANVNLREALRHQAIRDPLTGLFNRRYMQETLEREISRAHRNQRTLGVVFLDLDHFKRFNDTHGHDAGDALLREFGALLRRRLRAEDIVCRYGGEEFVVIMPEATLEATLQRAELLRTDVHALTVRHYGQVLGALTASLGVAMYPDHGATGELVLRAADQAMYRAKQAGRDQAGLAE